MSLIIDPGHGGIDSGALGNGIIEKLYNLAISNYQYKRFLELGVPVKITRTTDITLTPDQRAAMVKNSGMKHCLSNHINAGGGDGAELIRSKFATDKWPNLIAEEIKAVGQNVRRVFTRTLNSGQDYYFMHRETGAVETVICEYGFLDSKVDDVEQLKNYQTTYAEAVVKAYCRYAGYNYTSPIPVNPPQGDAIYKVQIGAFKDKANADRLKELAIKEGFSAFISIEN